MLQFQSSCFNWPFFILDMIRITGIADRIGRNFPFEWTREKLNEFESRRGRACLFLDFDRSVIQILSGSVSLVAAVFKACQKG